MTGVALSCVSLCVLPLRSHQEYGVRPRSGFAFLGNAEDGLERALAKAGGQGAPGQVGAVEAVVHVDFRPMEGAVFLVEVGNAQVAAGIQKLMEGAQDGIGVRNVVQRHGGVDEVEALGRERVGKQVQLHRDHVADSLRGDLFGKHVEHATGTVGQYDWAEHVLEREREQAGSAAVVERVHACMQWHGLADGVGHFAAAFLEYRIFVPLAGLAVEVGGVEADGWVLAHGGACFRAARGPGRDSRASSCVARTASWSCPCIRTDRR